MCEYSYNVSPTSSIQSLSASGILGHERYFLKMLLSTVYYFKYPTEHEFVYNHLNRNLQIPNIADSECVPLMYRLLPI